MMIRRDAHDIVLGLEHQLMETPPVVEPKLLLEKRREREARLSAKAETIGPKGMIFHVVETYHYTLEQRSVGEEYRKARRQHLDFGIKDCVNPRSMVSFNMTLDFLQLFP
jgi:hypothetical protein